MTLRYAHLAPSHKVRAVSPLYESYLCRADRSWQHSIDPDNVAGSPYALLTAVLILALKEAKNGRLAWSDIAAS
jgi:hypothetical protein